MTLSSPAGELGASGTGASVFAYNSTSAPSSYMFDGSQYLWWRFTAPTDGIYTFDSGLCTVGGATPTSDVPYAALVISPVTGSATEVATGANPGTSSDWHAVSMTAGDVIDVGLVTVSSLADFIGGINVPVLAVVRSNLLTALTAEDGLPGLAELHRGERTSVTTPNTTTVTLAAPDNAGGNLAYQYVALAMVPGDTAPTCAALDALSSGPLVRKHIQNGSAYYPGLTASASHALYVCDPFSGAPLTFDIDWGSSATGTWIVAMLDLGHSSSPSNLVAGMDAYPPGPTPTEGVSVSPPGGGAGHSVDLTGGLGADYSLANSLGPWDGSSGHQWLGVFGTLGSGIADWDVSQFSAGATRLDAGSSDRMVVEIDVNNPDWTKPSPSTGPATEFCYMVEVTPLGPFYVFTPTPVTPESIDDAFDLARCRFV